MTRKAQPRRSGGEGNRPSSRKHREAKLEGVRGRLADRLPEMLDASIEAYRRISEASDSGDPKAVASVQTGAKAALGNIETLIKLAEWTLAAPEAVPADRADETERLIAAARAAMGSDGCGSDDNMSSRKEG